MPFLSRFFFAIACFFRLLFDGRLAAAVERVQALPVSQRASLLRRLPTAVAAERHAIPPEETDVGDEPELSLRVTPARDTVQDLVSGTVSEDDDLDSVPPVSLESHETGLRRRSPPKPNSVPPRADGETSFVPPTEPSPGTTPPPRDVETTTDEEAAAKSQPSGATPAKTSERGAPGAVDPALSTSATHGQTSEEGKTSDSAPPVSEERFAARERGALLLLALLQREGRFVDFLQQDVTDFDDEQVGAAARVVHEGCRKALRGHLEVVPIRGESEGDKITLDDGYDVQATKLVGNVSGKPPYKGAIQHRGWRAQHLQLPNEVGDHDPTVLAQAEVEL